MAVILVVVVVVMAVVVGVISTISTQINNTDTDVIHTPQTRVTI